MREVSCSLSDAANLGAGGIAIEGVCDERVTSKSNH